MTLNRIVGLVVVAALAWTSIPVSAEEREGVLVPQPVLAARPIDCCAQVSSDRQLVQVPSPVTRIPGVRPSLRAIMWTAVGIGAFIGGGMVFVYSTGLNRG